MSQLNTPSENTEIRKLQFSIILVKGKAIPLKAWTGHEDSRKLRLPDFKTIDT